MAFVDLINQDLEDPEITRRRRLETDLQRFGRKDPVSLLIELKLNPIAAAQHEACLEYVLQDVDRIRTERTLLQEILIQAVATTQPQP